MDSPGVRQVPEGSGKQGKMEKTGCKMICGAPTTLMVKGLMMMMMMNDPREGSFQLSMSLKFWVGVKKPVIILSVKVALLASSVLQLQLHILIY